MATHARDGREVLLEVLRTEGVQHLFGNPGSTELPLIDALAGPAGEGLHYVLALQEATAVGMADGYAQATGRPAFLNLHTSAGLGNAIGNLTNAVANGSPLVVTAGQQDWRHIVTDPLLSGDLVGLARPVAKWVHEVRSVDELGTVMRRAFHDAASAPLGPVFVSLPMSMLDEVGDLVVPPPSQIERRTVPADLVALADLLGDCEIGSLAIVAGDEVAASHGVPELVALAEALGAPVLGASLHSTAVFPPAHPLYAGMLTPMATAIHAALAPYRRVLAVGAHTFMVYPFSPGSAVPDTVELLQVSPDALRLGRTFPTRLGVVGDPKATLAALLPLLQARVDESAVRAATAAAATQRRHEIDALEETARSRYATAPMDPMAAGHALVRALPPNTTVVDEAITTGFYVRGFHHWTEPGHYFFCKGGGLGWAMPAALGVSLARDREPVLCVVGDGSAMYSPQALWTAAHEQLPVVFAVVNNRQYLILKGYLRGMGRDSVKADRMVAMDLDDPPVDYVGLARALGVDATLVEKANDVGDAVQSALDSGRPHLLELPIAAP